MWLEVKGFGLGRVINIDKILVVQEVLRVTTSIDVVVEKLETDIVQRSPRELRLATSGSTSFVSGQ